MKLSIVIPAFNEEDSIKETVKVIFYTLIKNSINHEIIVINDNSKDNTLQTLHELSYIIPTLKYFTNQGPNGFGYAVRYGLEQFTGDCVAIMMADLSDSPDDLITFYRHLSTSKVDCIFGTRWNKGGKVYDYPYLKRIVNRIANFIIKIVMNTSYDDTTNAFKLYRKEVIEGVKPFLSPHFNLTIEIPLKAIIRGYSYEVLPNSWTNRKYGVSKLKLREMGSRYFFILMYCLIEKYFSKGDFIKKW